LLIFGVGHREIEKEWQPQVAERLFLGIRIVHLMISMGRRIYLGGQSRQFVRWQENMQAVDKPFGVSRFSQFDR
jgi:hypothetical protein